MLISKYGSPDDEVGVTALSCHEWWTGPCVSIWTTQMSRSRSRRFPGAALAEGTRVPAVGDERSWLPAAGTGELDRWRKGLSKRGRVMVETEQEGSSSQTGLRDEETWAQRGVEDKLISAGIVCLRSAQQHSNVEASALRSLAASCCSDVGVLPTLLPSIHARPGLPVRTREAIDPWPAGLNVEIQRQAQGSRWQMADGGWPV